MLLARATLAAPEEKTLLANLFPEGLRGETKAEKEYP